MVHGPAKQNRFPQSAGHGWNRDDRAGVLKRRAHIGKTAIGFGAAPALPDRQDTIAA
jgi:hypothetical protein